jgi:hypothetical protein
VIVMFNDKDPRDKGTFGGRKKLNNH